MKPIVIVSNRTPGKRPAAGGLAVALKKVLSMRDGFWFGWSGEYAGGDSSPQARFTEINDLNVATIDLNEADYQGYYEGFSNSVLWPAFHHRLDLVKFSEDDFDAYMRVNRDFAEALMAEVTPEHTIWVHDYHLIPLGHELRRLGAKNRIGFFLHIPVPGPEIFSAVPHSHQLIASLAAYDLVGLQADRDVEKLREQFEQAELPSVHDALQADEPQYLPRVVEAFPIGTDPEAFAQLADRPHAQRIAKRVRLSTAERQIIIGVDRLDYTKGLPERVAAYQCLLDRYPKWRRNVHMLQIAPASRDTIEQYKDINDELDCACGRIMGRFADPDWAPLNYVKRAYPQTSLAGLYRAARVALVTPLRDGMNLVAHEFIACQDEANPGVLVLSRFAGAAELFPEALLVNPHNVEEMAEALDRALSMPLAERQQRWRKLHDTVLKHRVDDWAEAFLARLADVPTWDSIAVRVDDDPNPDNSSHAAE